MAHHHHHHHHHGDTPIAITVLTNLAITIAEIVGGILSGSVALLADAFHNMGDTFTSALVWFGRVVARRARDGRHTFGLRRTEVIVSFIISLILMVSGIFIGFEIIKRIVEGGHHIEGSIMLPVAIIGLLGNVVGVALLFKEAKHSMSVRGAFVHLAADAMSSVLVVTEAILVSIGIKGTWLLDITVGTFIMFFLFRHAYEIFKESLHILMEGAPYPASEEDVRRALMEVCPEAIQVHGIKIFSITGKDARVNVHAVLPAETTLSRVDEIRDRLKSLLEEKWHMPVHLTLQVEGTPCGCKE